MSTSVPAELAESAPPGGPRPRPWLSAFLSLLLPGLGHLYAGRPGRAAAIFVAVQLWIVALLLVSFAAPAPFVRVALAVLVLGGVWLVVPLDAAHIARRSAPSQRRVTQRWYALAGTFLLGVFVIQPRVFAVVKRDVAHPFRISTGSGSMAPTLVPGDYVFAEPRVPDPVPRGAVVIYRVDGQRYSHRVAGGPGDTLAMRDFRLLVNGAPAVEPYAHGEPGAGIVEAPEFDWQRAHLMPGVDAASYRPTYGTWGPLVVPAGHYFLLGDDRANSLDSRYRGLIERDALAGRPVWIYLSRDPESGAVRWSRIGRAIAIQR